MAKQGRTLQELALELDRQLATRKDFIAPQGSIVARVADSEVVLDGLNGTPYGLTKNAHSQFADHLGIPARYYDRMKVEAPEALAYNLNVWLKKSGNEQRMIRTLDGRARGFLSPKFRPLDNYDLAHAVFPKLQELGAQIVSAELTETRFYLKAILPSLSDKLPEGQVWGNGHTRVADYSGETGKVVAAIVISNSEVGHGAFKIEPSVFTTWCTNLAVMIEAALRKYHVGRAFDATDNFEVFKDATRKADDRAFFLKVADVTEAAFNRDVFAAAVATIRDAAGRPIESKSPKAVVEVTTRRLGLPVGQSDNILNWLARGGDFSQWGLSSAITAAANDVEDYEIATQLERAGGQVIALSPSDWKVISTAEEVAA